MSQANTVKVRIAVVVNSDGHWSSSGWKVSDETPDDKYVLGNALEGLDGKGVEAHYFVTAELPVPAAAVVVAGTVEDAP